MPVWQRFRPRLRIIGERDPGDVAVRRKGPGLKASIFWVHDAGLEPLRLPRYELETYIPPAIPVQ
jgi:hypothetical protein